jgi:catechol 2,3-dioxygenase-like lactoylglutathione lyase family enzyme
MSGRRALHFVFKVGNRTETIKFYKDVLGMKVDYIDIIKLHSVSSSLILHYGRNFYIDIAT